MKLIGLVYKSISSDDLQKLFDLINKMVQHICNDRNWQIDAGKTYVLSKRNVFVFNCKDNISAASDSNVAKLVEPVCCLKR
jgi:hypothetical protein